MIYINGKQLIPFTCMQFVEDLEPVQDEVQDKPTGED